MVFASDVPEAVAKNTISNLVCEVTGIDSPVVIALIVVPFRTVPVRDGLNITVAPGIKVKVLFGVLELYNCAVMVTVVPVRVTGPEVLK